jgi:hypothetical protein
LHITGQRLGSKLQPDKEAVMLFALASALLTSHNVLAAALDLLEESTNWTRHPGVELIIC